MCYEDSHAPEDPGFFAADDGQEIDAGVIATTTVVLDGATSVAEVICEWAGIGANDVGQSTGAGDELYKPRGQNRRGRGGRKPNNNGTALPGDASKRARAYKGAPNHQDYRGIVKDIIPAAAKSTISTRQSCHATTKFVVSQFSEKGVRMSESWARKLLKDEATGKRVSPQKPGRVYVPAAIEERVVKLAKHLRDRKMPVFKEDIIGWRTALIQGTPYATNFEDMIASEGWYRRFLQRWGLGTGTERSLEMTRHEWLTV